MNRLAKASALSLAIALIAAFLAAGPFPPHAQTSGVAVGQKAPDFKLEPVGGGKPMSLSRFHGKAVAIVFWATWCPPCRHEIPALKDFYQTYTPKGVQVVTVTIDFRQTREDVVQFQQKFELPYIVLWDAGNKVSDTWGVEGIPTNLVLDADGVVRYRGHEVDNAMISVVDNILKGGKA